MDIYCPRCGEPWDVCSLVDDMTLQEAADFKAGKGCPCCIFRDGIEDKPFRAMASAALMDVLGDDLDGVAAMLEDFGI